MKEGSPGRYPMHTAQLRLQLKVTVTEDSWRTGEHIKKDSARDTTYTLKLRE